MPRSLKLKNNDYIDSAGVAHNKELLSNILNSIDIRKTHHSNNTTTYSISSGAWTSMNTTSFANVPLGYYFLVVFLHITTGVTTAFEFNTPTGFTSLLSNQVNRGGGGVSTGNTNLIYMLPIQVTSSTISFVNRIYSNGAGSSESRQCFLVPISM